MCGVKGSCVCLTLFVMENSSMYLSAKGKNPGVRKRLNIWEGEGIPTGTGYLHLRRG